MTLQVIKFSNQQSNGEGTMEMRKMEKFENCGFHMNILLP